MEPQFHPASLHTLSVDAIDERIARIEEPKKHTKHKEKPAARKAPAAMQPAQAPAAAPGKHDKEIAEKKKQLQLERDDAEKTRLLDQIEAYRNRFKHLKKRNKCDNMKASLAELRDEVHYIEAQLGHKEGKEPIGMAFVAGMYGLEYANNEFNPLGLNLAGLGQTAQMNLDKFQDILDELAIKYGMKMSTGVELRALFMVSTMMITVHESNNGGGPISSAMGQLQRAQETASRPAPKVDATL